MARAGARRYLLTLVHLGYMKQTGETSAIAVLDRNDVVHLAYATPERQLKPVITIGRRFSALYNSTGLVLIVCNDDQTIDRYLVEIPLAKLTRCSISSRPSFVRS